MIGRNMNNLTFSDMYNAIGTRDSNYEGLFITAVKTTGIFCRPSCRARKPKAENVIFYNTSQEALQAGFRPCQVCKPMENLGETPEYIRRIIDELHKNPYLRIKDEDLEERNIEPNQIRRWFKANHNMTFHAYQRMIRINSAFNKLNEGNSVTNTAFDGGYNSLSGFNDGFKSIFGESPTESNGKQVLNIMRFTTPLSPMFACASSKGICLFEFTDRKMLEIELKDLQRRLNAVILPGKNRHLEQLESEIEEYFDGRRITFTVPIDAPGTDFQKSVWKVLQEIPYGTTRSYKEQAEILGNPNAIRAVASANGHNRISIIIPCHRVIGSDGNLIGYGGGLHRKKWLLDFEKSNLEKVNFNQVGAHL